MRYRKGEQAQLWFRSGRVFRVDGQWYFHTREGISVGPYPSQFEASVEAELLLADLADLEPAQARRRIRDFAFRTVEADASGSFLASESFTDYVVRETATELTQKELFEHAG